MQYSPNRKRTTITPEKMTQRYIAWVEQRLKAHPTRKLTIHLFRELSNRTASAKATAEVERHYRNHKQVILAYINKDKYL